MSSRSSTLDWCSLSHTRWPPGPRLARLVWLRVSHYLTNPLGAHGGALPKIQVLTGHLEDVGDPLVLEQARVRHHAGKWLSIHAAAGHQMEF